MRLKISTVVIILLLGLTTNILGADLNKKESEDFFWKIVDSIRNESPDYFNFFSETSKITYNWPKSYMMGPRTISRFEAFKDSQGRFWYYAENHSFDLEKPEVIVKGDTATISAVFYERYTMSGYTFSNKAKHEYRIAKQAGKLKIVEFINDITDISDEEYFDRLNTVAKKSGDKKSKK